MPDLEITCTKGDYKRTYKVGEADFDQSFKTAGEIRNNHLDFLEEQIHHMNNFADHQYQHGEFNVKVNNEKIGLLEVTRDEEAAPYFYPGGVRV